MLALTPVAQRLALASDIGNPGEGGSLLGVNINDLPDGVLAAVASTHRVYQLRTVTATQVPVAGVNNGANVLNGNGSPATGAGRRWVAVQQTAQATLAGGTIVATGFALQATDVVVALLVTVGGTAGFLHAVQTTDHSITVTSSQGADTSVVQILVIPAGTV